MTMHREGMFVVQTRGKHKGRVGIVCKAFDADGRITPIYTVKFGSDGPFSRLLHTGVRAATRDEANQALGV